MLPAVRQRIRSCVETVDGAIGSDQGSPQTRADFLSELLELHTT